MNYATGVNIPEYNGVFEVDIDIVDSPSIHTTVIKIDNQLFCMERNNATRADLSLDPTVCQVTNIQL